MICELFEEATALLSMKNNGLTISTKVENELPLVLIDKIQIDQVLINFMKNAVEAMEHSSTRSITLAAEKTAGVVTIRVAGSGPGIPSDVAEKLFQSFYATQRSGMGLSICRTLITANGGQIWAEANPAGVPV